MADSETSQEDKTEEATPERREDSREKGQVVVSRDLTSVLVLGGTVLFASIMLPKMFLDLRRLFTTHFEAIATKRVDKSSIIDYLGMAWMQMLQLTLPIFAVTFVVAIVATFGQTRFNFSWQRVSPSWEKLDPIAGIKRMFSMQTVVETLKGLAKLTAVFIVGWLILRSEWVKVPELMNYPINSTWNYWGTITEQLFWSVCGLLFLIAGFDYGYHWFTHERQLKMTKQEVKEEYKRRESDPMMKARMRRMARDMMNRKTLDRTKEATVLITNPTHFSVALKYELGMTAPVVVAKGVDFLALRMREVAKDQKIPIIENRPLARELYATVKEGQEIPDKLFKAVAEIIRYVFKLKGRALSRPGATR